MNPDSPKADTSMISGTTTVKTLMVNEFMRSSPYSFSEQIKSREDANHVHFTTSLCNQQVSKARAVRAAELQPTNMQLLNKL
jgi:hypothetical protein